MTTNLPSIHSLDLIHGIAFVKVEDNGKIFTGPLSRTTERSSSQNPFVPNAGLRADLSGAALDTQEEVEGLSRDDFDTPNDYARYLLRSGLLPESSHTPQWTRAATGDYVGQFRSAAAFVPSKLKPVKSPHYICGSDAEKAYRAVAYGNWLGSVFNVHITIVWKTVGKTTDTEVSNCTQQFHELFRKWNRERGFPTRWLYVQERSTKRGLHTHFLTSVDRLYKTDFAKWVDKAIRTIVNRASVRGVRNEETVKIRHRSNDDLRAQWILFQYLMKGIDPDAELADLKDKRKRRAVAEVASIRKRKQGAVFTKRVGVSRSVDRGASVKNGFLCALDQGADNSAALYTDSYWRAFKGWEHKQQMREILESIERADEWNRN